MKYYKVLRRQWGTDNLVSAYAQGKAAVEYEVGKLSTPPEWLNNLGYGLTVFDTLEHAVAFTGSSLFFIFEVSVMGRIREPLLPYIRSENLIIGNMKPAGTYTWPEGTLMVDGIILLKRASLDEIADIYAEII